MIRTPVCDLLGIEHPIRQGGMAWAATAELAPAVSNAGGLGVRVPASLRLAKRSFVSAKTTPCDRTEQIETVGWRTGCHTTP